MESAQRQTHEKSVNFSPGPRGFQRLAVLAIISVGGVACSDGPSSLDRPGDLPALERLSDPDAVALSATTLSSLTRQSLGGLDPSADVLLDEGFGDNKGWSASRNGDVNDGSIQIADGKIRVLPGKSKKTLPLKLDGHGPGEGKLSGVPFAVRVKIKLPEGVDLATVRRILSVMESRQGVGDSRFHEAHSGWRRVSVRNSEDDGWVALSQIIVPGKKTKGLALRVDSSARGLKDGDPVLVERLVIHRASSEELVLGLMRKAGARDLHPVEIEVGGERRSSFLSLDSEAVEIAIGSGKGRLLRFGVAFPAAGTVGHSGASLIGIEVVAEGDREDVLFREDYRVPEEGSTELVSDRWFEKSIALPDIRDRAVLRLTAHSAGEGSVLAAFGAIVLSGPEREKPPPNVILISIDTLRGDRLGLNGGEHNQGVSPALDRFSQEAIVFDGAIAQAPFTLPSHVSMMSGQYPSVHGVGLITQNINPLRTPVLGDLLAREGYLAGAFTGGGFVHHKVGFGKGFDTYCVLDPLGWDTMGRSLDWVRANQSVPFFLFFHTYAVHEFAYDDADYLERFDPSCRSQVHHVRTVFDQLRTVTEPGEYVEADFRCLDNRYAAGIRMTDDAIGRLVDCLSSEGMLDNTLLIITSDHGQELLEHGAIQHGLSLYEELVHVPLIIRLPGGGESIRRISDPVQVVDIFPTVLEYLGIDVPVGIQGQSLITYLEGNDSDPMRPAAFSEVDYPFGKIHPRIAALRSNHWKLIHNLGPLTTSGGDYTEFEFFNLGEDPDESQNLAGQSESYEGFHGRLDRLRKTLTLLSESLDSGQMEEGEMDPEILEQLRELGYIR